MEDPDLTLAKKIINLQKAIDEATRREILLASLQEELLDVNQRKFMKNLWWKQR